jgi:hypothetical protein
MSVVLVKGYQKCYSKKVFTSFSIYPGEALTLSFILLKKIPKLGLKMSVVMLKGYQKCYRNKVFTSFLIYPGEALSLSTNFLNKNNNKQEDRKRKYGWAAWRLILSLLRCMNSATLSEKSSLSGRIVTRFCSRKENASSTRVVSVRTEVLVNFVPRVNTYFVYFLAGYSVLATPLLVYPILYF